jgi:hypothetical protein
MISENNSLSLLAYTSLAKHHMSHQELIDLLSGCRDSNSKVEITGILLYLEGCFFQVLEGEPDKLQVLFEKISKDTRHHSVMKLTSEPLTERGFANWTMGYQSVTREELVAVTGLTDFLDTESIGFYGMETTRARKLIEYFRDGRWIRKDLTQYKHISGGA